MSRFTSYRVSPYVGEGEGCFWGLVIALVAVAAFTSTVSPDSWPVSVGFVMLSLAPLALGLRTRRVRLQYANAAFEIEAPPRVGGKLQGSLYLPHAVPGDASIRADLVCQGRAETSEGIDPILGRSYAYGAAATPPAPGTSRFPLSVDIPASGLASGRNGARWTLTCTAQAGFSGLDVSFRISVESAEG